MHRSGTSLVAQACAAAGISAGPESELLSAQADNPEGFYENRRLVEINEELLEKAGGSWFSPPVQSLEIVPDPDEFSQLLHHLEQKCGGQYLLKDPRLCLTWSCWEPLAGDVTLLYVYRSPLSVAWSLAKRNQFPLQFGLQLWELYNRRTLSLLAGRDYVVVSYDQLASGEVALQSVVEQLRERGFDCEPEKASGVFNSDLRHFREEDETDPPLSESQRNLHRHCEAVCRGALTGEESREDTIGLSPETQLLAQIHDTASALAPLARIVETANERDDALALIEERTTERDTALASLQSLESDYDALAKAHEQEKQLHTKAASTLFVLTDEHKALADAHRELVDENTRLGKDHQHLIELHDELHQQYGQLTADHAQLQGQADSLQEKADYLFFKLTESFRTLLIFETSTLARVQRVTRSVYRVLTGQRGRNSAYEDLLEHAHEHFREFEIKLPEPAPNKLSMAGDVLRYVWQNPAGSVRSFSWARFKRAASVFFGSSSADLAVWVNARFPDSPGASEVFDPASLSEVLDTLELDFIQSDEPLVSIVIPVYNDYRVTMNCLQSIHRYRSDIPFEIILADDCSSDLTTSIADRVAGIRVARTSQNQRFLRNCNQAAELAQGQYILFLNNDTAVTDGWLDALLIPFADPTVGITGPKLLFADGKLQEAGGIIWRDASGWNFGRADDPEKPAYNYLREVDYVSGAALCIRSELWKSLGGFDDRFAPAYYEDADICFAARAAGYRVVYQPESVFYHFEGVSNGTDLNAGVKQHQVTNQAVFLEKWRLELEQNHFTNAEHVIHARDRSRSKPCILVIDHYVPHHDKDAGGRSTYMYIKLLLELGCRVQFMGANFFPHQPYTGSLQALGVEVLVGESIARHLDSWLEEHAPYIDEIFLHRPHVAEQFLPHLERMKPRPPISFFGHDLHHLRIQREAALKDDDALRRDARQWRKRELAVFKRVERVYYFSDVEVEALKDLVPESKLRRIPLYAMRLGDLPDFAPEAPNEILFVGGYNHPPNVDAALWLAEDILPAVRDVVPDVHLHLVGSNPPTDVLGLACEGITVHGYVSDEALEALYRRVAAVVVPLRYGAGVKGKLIEAIANHVPVVTTDIGVEGIPDAETVMWIENTASAIARQVSVLLLGDESASTKLERHAAWLHEYFDLECAADVLRADIPRLRLPEEGIRAFAAIKP